jgi:hypothetical protein
MIFPDAETGNYFDSYCDRYATEVQARAGHDQALAMVKSVLEEIHQTPPA